jgi:hypothetical protein
MMLVARLICSDARQVVVERRPSCLDGGLEVPCSASVHCTDGGGAFQGQFAHGSSVAAEFELVCTRTIFRGSLGSLFFIGFGFGSFLAGRMADRVGRRKTIRVFNALMLGGSMSFLAPSFETYLVLRVLAGVACGGNIVVVYVLMMEFVGKAHRGWMGGVGMNGLWALGGAAVALHAAWMHALWNPAGAAPAGLGPAGGWTAEWRAVSLLPAALIVLLHCVSGAVPESPRWFVAQATPPCSLSPARPPFRTLSPHSPPPRPQPRGARQGRPDSAMAILRRAAAANGTSCPAGVLRSEIADAAEEGEEAGEGQVVARHVEADGGSPGADPEAEDEGARLNPRADAARGTAVLLSSSRVLGVPLWRITLLNLLCWFTASFSYYGLALNTGNLNGPARAPRCAGCAGRAG